MKKSTKMFLTVGGVGLGVVAAGAVFYRWNWNSGLIPGILPEKRKLFLDARKRGVTHEVEAKAPPTGKITKTIFKKG